MENENTILRLVEELVSAKDEVSGVRSDYAASLVENRQTREKLDNLIDIILDNTKLDYSETDLSLVNDNSILAFVRFIDPDTYHDRLENLLRLKDRQEELSRLKAEEDNKSKKGDGKK